MINSYHQSELEEFRWYDVEFLSEVKEGIVFIAFAGEYYGAYPSYVEEELFFSASTGEKLTYLDIPFQALFSLDGYLTFMQRFWLPVVKNEFKEAIECADSEPYCSYYDVSGYSVDGNKFSMSLTNDCYPRVIRACAPSASLTLSVDSLTEYLTKEKEYSSRTDTRLKLGLISSCTIGLSQMTFLKTYSSLGKLIVSTLSAWH